MKRLGWAQSFLFLLTSARRGQEAVLQKTDSNFSGVEAAVDYWVFNDRARGFAKAKAFNKLMMIVFRCIP